MLVSIVQIGNSRGIRLPKAILGQLRIADTMELEVENQQIILKPVHAAPRAGWQDAFVNMHDRKEDTMLIAEDYDSEALECEW